MELTDEEYEQLREKDKLKVKEFLFSKDLAAEDLNEILEALMEYDDKYTVECFDKLHLEHYLT